MASNMQPKIGRPRCAAPAHRPARRKDARMRACLPAVRSNPERNPLRVLSVLNLKLVGLKLIELSSLRTQGPTERPHTPLRSGSLLAQGRQYGQRARSLELRNRDT